MKKAMVVVGLMLFCGVASAEMNFVASYDYYLTPNAGNNYNDGQGFSLGAEYAVLPNLSLTAYYSHLTDIHFPSVDDPKGSFGELRGHGVFGGFDFLLPFNEKVTPYLSADVGYATWDFKENPFLQDQTVTVSVDDSLVLKGGVGVRYKVNDAWDIVAEVGWMDTNIGKDARDANGREFNILDDEEIGLQYIYWKIQGVYEF